MPLKPTCSNLSEGVTIRARLAFAQGRAVMDSFWARNGRYEGMKRECLARGYGMQDYSACDAQLWSWRLKDGQGVQGHQGLVPFVEDTVHRHQVRMYADSVGFRLVRLRIGRCCLSRLSAC